MAATYIGCPYTCLPDGRLRIRVPRDRMGGLAIGQNICIRHSAYGPTVFLLKNARQTVISDVTVHAAGEIPVIAVQACHDAADTGDAHVHRNICVRDHVFAGKSGRVVRIAATDGVVMEGNRLEHYTAVLGCAPYETPGCTGVSCVPVCGEEENGNILASDRD